MPPQVVRSDGQEADGASSSVTIGFDGGDALAQVATATVGDHPILTLLVVSATIIICVFGPFWVREHGKTLRLRRKLEQQFRLTELTGSVPQLRNLDLEE